MYIETKLGHEVVCVDPNPHSYGHEVVRSPDYPVLSRLMKAQPELDDVVLLLHHPEPSEIQKGVDYDIEAVIKLRPKAVFIHYEIMGADGSDRLHRWMATIPGMENYCQDPPIRGPYVIPKDRYRVQDVYAATDQRSYRANIYGYVVLVRDD